MIIIYKTPKFENDDCLFLLKNFNKNNYKLDKYIKIKLKLFEKQIINPKMLLDYEFKPSLQNIKELTSLQSTIYTKTCEINNSITYKNIIKETIKELRNNPNQRRLMLRIVNDYSRYLQSIKNKKLDVSCFSTIHYLKNTVNLCFRASDMKNELLTDIITIQEYFIKPIYKNISISIKCYISTCQNIENLFKIFEKTK